MLTRIALDIDANTRTAGQASHKHPSFAHAVSHATRALAEDTNVQDIVVFTRSGNTARLISKDRPRVPILAYTPSEHVYRQLALWWGVWPYRMSMQGTTEELIALAEQRLQNGKLVQHGEYVVIMGGMPIASQARTNFVKLHRIGNDG